MDIRIWALRRWRSWRWWCKYGRRLQAQLAVIGDVNEPYDIGAACNFSIRYGWRDLSNPRLAALEQEQAKIDVWIENICANVVK